ncbi:MAG: hypothetical protein WC789_13800 [Lentisphaeria bacterium]
MAENIGGTDLLGSGGHVWHWLEKPLVEKRLTSVGATGEGRIVLASGGMAFRIVGAHGEPPLFRVSDAVLATAKTAMNAIEAAIQSLRDSGVPQTWEDDVGRTGSYLVITSFVPGPRQYGYSGSTWQIWETYELAGVELAGRP